MPLLCTRHLALTPPGPTHCLVRQLTDSIHLPLKRHRPVLEVFPAEHSAKCRTAYDEQTPTLRHLSLPIAQNLDDETVIRRRFENGVTRVVVRLIAVIFYYD